MNNAQSLKYTLVSMCLIMVALFTLSPGHVEAQVEFLCTQDAINNTSGLSSHIEQANASQGDYTIRLATPGCVFSLLGQIQVSDTMGKLTIYANGAVFDGNGQTRLFWIDPGASLELHDISIMNGYASGASSTGGGIRNSGTLNLYNSTIESNYASETGGGIYAFADSTTNIYESNIKYNKARKSGGGIYNFNGSLNIYDTTIQGNIAGYENVNIGDGGGIRNLDGGTVWIERSTLAYNQALLDGGGVSTTGDSGSVIILSSTLTTNEAGQQGGGIYAEGRNVVTTLDSTIFGNQANNSGGIYISISSSVLFVNSILAKNIPNDFNPEARLGGVFNFIGGEPLLGNLQSNGGFTQTHLPMVGSPVIDAGSACQSIDQLGNLRPQGNGCDIGAVEIVPNNPPETVSDTYSVFVTEILEVDALNGVLANDTDPDGDALMAELVSEPEFGILMFNEDGSFIYTPGDEHPDTDMFEYRAVDARGARSAPQRVAINLLLEAPPVNNPPVASLDTYTLLGSDTLEVDAASGVLANDTDPDGDALTAELVSAPESGMLTLNEDGSFIYTPDDDRPDTDMFEYRAVDARGARSAPQAVTINLLEAPPVNNPPVALLDTYTLFRSDILNVDASNGVLANDTDPDGDALTAELVSGPEFGTLTFNEDGAFTYTPDAEHTGTVTFEYIARDTRQAESNLQEVVINIQNRPPLAVPDTYILFAPGNLEVDIANGVLANDIDPDGDVLKAVLVSEPEFGTLTFNEDGSFIYTLDDERQGNVVFAYKAVDIRGAESIEQFVTINLSITPSVNHPPVAVEDTYSISITDTLEINAPNGVLSNDYDPDGDDLVSAEMVLMPDQGELAFNDSDGSFTYTPDGARVGTVTFTYKAVDARGAESNLQLVTINLVELAPYPVGLYTTNHPRPVPIRPSFHWTHADSPEDVIADGDYYQLRIYLEVVPASGNTFQQLIHDAWYHRDDICDGIQCVVDTNDFGLETLTTDNLNDYRNRPLYAYGLTNAVYYWDVRAYYENNGTYSNWNRTPNFQISEPVPNAPSLPYVRHINNDDGSTVSSIVVPYQPFVTYYDVYFNNNVYKLPIDVCSDGWCSLSNSGLVEAGEYLSRPNASVWIRAQGPAGINPGPQEGWVMFETAIPTDLTVDFDSEASTVSGQSPRTALFPVLSWRASRNALYYRVWIGEREMNFEYITLFDGWLHAGLGEPGYPGLNCLSAERCSFNTGLALDDSEGKTYIWYVEAWGYGGSSSIGSHTNTYFSAR